MIRLTLPIPPSTNTAYRNTRDRGGRALTNKARNYKSAVQILTSVEARKQKWQYKDERLGLSIAFYFPNKRRHDLGNCEKLLVDSIAKALNFDDAVIDKLYLERRAPDAREPRCEVTLIKLSDEI